MLAGLRHVAACECVAAGCDGSCVTATAGKPAVEKYPAGWLAAYTKLDLQEIRGLSHLSSLAPAVSDNDWQRSHPGAACLIPGHAAPCFRLALSYFSLGFVFWAYVIAKRRQRCSSARRRSYVWGRICWRCRRRCRWSLRER